MRYVNDEFLITFTDYWPSLVLIRVRATLSRDPGDGMAKKESDRIFSECHI